MRLSKFTKSESKSLKNPLKLAASLSLLAIFTSITGVLAFTSNIAISVKIDDPEAKAGDIVSYTEGNFSLSNHPFDLTMFGVIVDTPIAAFEDSTQVDNTLVLTSGEALVNTSNENGDIKKGDYITSSETPGTGVKAISSGQILGMATEDAGDSGQVAVYIDIKTNFAGANVRGSLFSFAKSGLEAPFVAPLTSFRYFLAAIIVIISFLIGFASFGRVSHKSVEALGRNPLAKSSIKGLVIFNFMLTFAIVGIGLLIAYLILML